METPLYDELVVKYYLSKGIRPFSYPHEPVDAPSIPKLWHTPGEPLKRGQIIGIAADVSKAKSYFSLHTSEPVQYDISDIDSDKMIKYDYFRL